MSHLYPYSARLTLFMFLPLTLVSAVVVISKFDIYVKAIALVVVILVLLKFFYFSIQITRDTIVLSRLIYRNKVINWKDVTKLTVSIPSNPVIPIQMKVNCGTKRTMIESKNQEIVTTITACFLAKGIDVVPQDKPLAQQIINNAKLKVQSNSSTG